MALADMIKGWIAPLVKEAVAEEVEVWGTQIRPLIQEAVAAEVAALQTHLARLDALLAGIKRGTSAPDAAGRTVDWISFPCRVGVQTEWWGKQPPGEGAAFSVGTSDKFATYFENEPTDANAGAEDLITSFIGVVAPHARGRSIGLRVMAVNNPNGNIAVEAASQYAPSAQIKTTPIVVKEINASDETLHAGVVAPGGVERVS